MLTHFLFLNTVDAFGLMAFFARFSVWHHSSHNPFAHFAFKVCYCFYCHCWRYYFVCLPVGMRVFVCVCVCVPLCKSNTQYISFFPLVNNGSMHGIRNKNYNFSVDSIWCLLHPLFILSHSVSACSLFTSSFFWFDFEFSNGNFHGLTRKIGQTFAWQSRNR